MGKRELLIAIAFVVVGVVVYQVAAPPAKPGQGFSFSNFFSNVRRELRGNNASAKTVIAGTIPAPVNLKTARLTGVTGEIHVVGEARTDIAYELTVESTGPDEPTALDYAKQTKVSADDLGDSVGLRVSYPTPGRQTSEMVLRVPARLGVRLEATAGVDVKGVASVQFGGVSGDSTVSEIAGAVTGLHRNGELTVTNVNNVKLTCQRSRSVFEGVAQDLILDVRDGGCQIRGARGAIEIDQQRSEFRLERNPGTLRVSGSDGRLMIVEPGGEVHVDVRRMPIDVSVQSPVIMSILTSADPIRLYVDGAPAITVDALSTGGSVDGTDFGLQPESLDHDKRLMHAFGSGSSSARIILRNQGGAIAIRKGGMPEKPSKNPK